ncbi:hypothetical protein HPB48_023501 [Haemaphysalis longicornis]|uniref:Uncharacterized protein n=1 Tax=Haemaphysalis longicornis TaxID=44386 RepID=A0A9J6H6A3_HAELO|nr:hypothetical protein HPB48_023501 [Haemaphysalis longicornis]
MWQGVSSLAPQRLGGHEACLWERVRVGNRLVRRRRHLMKSMSPMYLESGGSHLFPTLLLSKEKRRVFEPGLPKYSVRRSCLVQGTVEFVRIRDSQRHPQVFAQRHPGLEDRTVEDNIHNW